ncbi:PH domain-containing protein [Amycolatopsis anabasis]|uniref:PH domain-containing protein n=1 Tax=Amycolatopsis anabasis TaxID=1840409 RepID=UPI001C5525AC|nr:PH domain-containing protein [Amycolatopsis anabasis]
MNRLAVRAEVAWRTLDPRMIAVHCAWLLAPLTSIGLAALATGGRLGWRAWSTLGALVVTFGVLSAAGLIRWRRTRYRVTADHFELRSGLVTRTLRSVPLHRIRNVDLTASPLHRLLGLTVVAIGTAGDGDLRVDALTRAAAERLRAELTRHAEVGATGEPVLAAWNPRWVRYAPLTFWIFGGVFVVAGTAYRILDGVGVEPWRIGFLRQAFEDFGASALWLTVPLAVLALAALGALGAIALHVENWWRFRLEWTDAGTLHVRRGLCTTRSVSMERRRLRGVVLSEPLLLRAGGGAKVTAVVSGLGNAEENRRRSALLPPAPRAEALRVASRVLGGPWFDRALRRHPRVALRRRILRGLSLVVLPLTAALAILGVLFTPVLLHCAWLFPLLATPVVWWLAADAYRNLGHGLDERHLLARSGTFSRDSVALRRSGIVAWTFSSSPFARRAGVVTLTAAVAAGEEGYRIPDLAAAEAPGFADEAAPGILTEFLR